jgi:nucleotide-binding universal stress UspA family protein
MKKILIAYDGSAGAQHAVNEMLRAGLPERCEARVIAIADVWLPPEPEISEDIFGNRSERNAIERFQKAKEILAEAKETAVCGARLLHSHFPTWSISNVAKADSPSWGIVSEATRWGADLVVIGSHGRTQLEKFFLGSVSYKVVAEARCSVRVVRGPKREGDGPLRIIIGLDGSDDSREAANEVLERRWLAESEVELVTVVDPKLRSSIEGQTENSKRPEDWVETVALEIKGKFESKQIKSHFKEFEGDPKRILLQEASDWKADAIFLGARGLDHGARQYLGTLASAVCTRAPCTVEIVRKK